MNVFNHDTSLSGYITSKEILSLVTQEDIFELIFRSKPVEFEKYKSPFRNDNSAGCFFVRCHNGILRFKDYATTETYLNLSLNSLNCFDSVQVYFKLKSYNESLNFIYNTLIKGKKLPPISNEFKIREKVDLKIAIKPRMLEYRDQKFWSNYGITSDNLREDSVVAVQGYVYNNRVKNVNTTVNTYDLCYAYQDFETNVKLYRPHQRKELKFFTNCNSNDIGGIKHLPLTGDFLIISKSYKDYRVIKNLGYNVVWFQNEGMIPKEDVLLNLCSRFNKIAVLFDNDIAGINASVKVSNEINTLLKNKSKPFTTPLKYLHKGIKDPSDMVSAGYKNELIDFLSQLKQNYETN
jgi:hypothetical protein